MLKDAESLDSKGFFKILESVDNRDSWDSVTFCRFLEDSRVGSFWASSKNTRFLRCRIARRNPNLWANKMVIISWIFGEVVKLDEKSENSTPIMKNIEYHDFSKSGL